MIKCGILGSNGYLGSQLRDFITNSSFKNDLNICSYNRNSGKFSEKDCDEIDILLNLGSPNETISRDANISQRQIISEWKSHIENIINNFAPKKIIHVSTITVFNKNENIITEDSEIFSTDPYGIIHIECLEIMNILCDKKSIELINIFPSNIYGSLKKNLLVRESLILNKIIISSIRGKSIELASRCNSFRDFMWIEDFIKIMLTLVKNYKYVDEKKIIISTGNSVNFFFQSLKRNSNQSLLFGDINDDDLKINYENLLIKSIFPSWTTTSIEDSIFRLKKIYN